MLCHAALFINLSTVSPRRNGVKATGQFVDIEADSNFSVENMTGIQVKTYR